MCVMLLILPPLRGYEHPQGSKELRSPESISFGASSWGTFTGPLSPAGCLAGWVEGTGEWQMFTLDRPAVSLVLSSSLASRSFFSTIPHGAVTSLLAE